MTAKPNSLHPRPDYCLHRNIQSKEFNPAVIVADSLNLQTLFETGRNDRASISCKGWKSVDFLIVMEGGAAPTVDIQPLEHVRAEDAFPGATDEDEGFVVLASTIAGITSGGINEVVVDQGRLFLRLHAVANAPTDIRMYIRGKEKAVSATGQS